MRQGAPQSTFQVAARSASGEPVDYAQASVSFTSWSSLRDTPLLRRRGTLGIHASVHSRQARCLRLLSSRGRPDRGPEMASTILGSRGCRGPCSATDAALVAAYGGTLWIKTGANALEVSRQADHTSVSFTLDRYGHLFSETGNVNLKWPHRAHLFWPHHPEISE
jgi:hypothetical protein